MKLKSLIGAIALLAAAARPAAAEGPRIGQVKTARGEAVILRDTVRLPAKAGDLVYAKDVVETGEHGSIGITFIDETVFSTGPNSELALDQFRFDSPAAGGEMLADMRRGTLSVTSGNITKKGPDALKIRTPTAMLGVRGTTFVVQVVGERR